MRQVIGIGFIAAASLLAGNMYSAQAQAPEEAELNLGHMTLGYTYFNRPGADLTAHNHDLGECLIDASPMISADEASGSGMNLGLAGALIGGAISSATHRGTIASAIENCMIVYGWRLVRLSDAEGAGLAALPPAELAARLEPWIGADQPHGDVVRTWHNDAANGTVRRFSLRPPHGNNSQLSLIAATTSTLRSLKLPPPPPPPPKMKLAPKWPRKPLKPGETASLAPAGSAIVIVNIRHPSLSHGQGFLFERVGTNPMDPNGPMDGDTAAFVAGLSILSGKAEGTFLAFAVPPSRWRLSGAVGGILQLSYCLGSPSFELKAGQVVYAGAFDLGADKIGPDLELASVKLWLAGTPAADSVVPAVYTNGSRGPCRPNSIYALEFEGAPFESGYALGSKVPSAIRTR